MIEILVESSSARQSLNTHAVFALGVTSEFPSPALVLVFCCCRGGEVILMSAIWLWEWLGLFVLRNSFCHSCTYKLYFRALKLSSVIISLRRFPVGTLISVNKTRYNSIPAHNSQLTRGLSIAHIKYHKGEWHCNIPASQSLCTDFVSAWKCIKICCSGTVLPEEVYPHGA